MKQTPAEAKLNAPLICVVLIIIGIVVYDYVSCTRLPPSEPPGPFERVIDMRQSGSH